MARLEFRKNTTVGQLKRQYENEVGAGELRVYNGNKEASDSDLLYDIGLKTRFDKEPSNITFLFWDFRTSSTVGTIIEGFQKKLNLKVKIFTNDNWVAVLDGITLATINDIPVNATKAKMEKYIGYKRD